MNSIKKTIIALSMLCAVESCPISPHAIAVSPFVAGAIYTALIYKNVQNYTYYSSPDCIMRYTNFGEALYEYMMAFNLGLVPVANLRLMLEFKEALEEMPGTGMQKALIVPYVGVWAGILTYISTTMALKAAEIL